MNQSFLRHTVSAFVLLLAIVACVLPGQAPRSVPVPNSVNIETAVAGTAQAAATQTAAAQSVPTPRTGTAIEQLENGSTIYTDYDAGFEITFPVGWLAVRPNSEEFNTALAKEGAVNPWLHNHMTKDLAEYDSNYDRLFAYILRPDIEKNVIFGHLYLKWDPNDINPIDNVAMGKLVQRVESLNRFPGIRVDTAQLHEDTRVKMIEIGGPWMTSNEQGETTSFYLTFILFKPTPNSTILAIFMVLRDYQGEISPDVQSIRTSITTIEP